MKSSEDQRKFASIYRIASVSRKKPVEKQTRGLFWFPKCMIYLAAIDVNFIVPASLSFLTQTVKSKMLRWAKKKKH